MNLLRTTLLLIAASAASAEVITVGSKLPSIDLDLGSLAVEMTEEARTETTFLTFVFSYHSRIPTGEGRCSYQGRREKNGELKLSRGQFIDCL